MKTGEEEEGDEEERRTRKPVLRWIVCIKMDTKKAEV